MPVVMHQHNRSLAAGFAIGQQHGTQFAHERIHRRHSIGSRAGRASGRALAAASANMWIDAHMVARRYNGAGGAKIETARAAGNLRPRMGAELWIESDIARFDESADEVARLQDRLQHRSRVARIGAQIAVAQIGRSEKRRTAREIENDAASGPHAIARGSERQHAARGRSRLRKIVDRYVKGTEMSCRRWDLAF